MRLARLPVVSAREAVKALRRLEFVVIRQIGRHVDLWSDETRVLVTVPNHEELARGTLLSIIKQARVTREEFLREL